MTPTVHLFQVAQRPTPHFNEGASSANRRITTVVLAALATMVSFLSLPFESALLTSMGIAGLLILLSLPTDESPSRWYHYFNPVRYFYYPEPRRRYQYPEIQRHREPPPTDFQQGIPLRQAGPRVEIGSGNRPALPSSWNLGALFGTDRSARPQPANHVPVGRDHQPIMRSLEPTYHAPPAAMLPRQMPPAPLMRAPAPIAQGVSHVPVGRG